MYSTLKYLHIGFAIASIAGFVLRGIWMIYRPSELRRPVVRVTPHILDTAFLISGIWLILLLHLQVTQQPWLIAKLVGLVAYVLFGIVALRAGRTLRVRCTAFIAALLTYVYIFGVALSKSPASWLAV